MTRAVKYRSGAGNRVSVYERVTERVTELLEQGVVPWQKPWHAKVGPASQRGVWPLLLPRAERFHAQSRGFRISLVVHPPNRSTIWAGISSRERKSRGSTSSSPGFRRGDPADSLEVDTDEVEISTRRRPVLIIRAFRVVNVDQCAGPGIDNFRAKHPLVERASEQRQRRDRCMRTDR